jgi:geranyl-CoA carboxylase alpha subunit
MHHRPFKSVLIANRGEIAARIIREAQALGLRTIAVCSDADREAEYVSMADAFVHIGPPAAAASYLDVERILAAASATGAEAIHPGYGFLSENPDFAEAVIAAGLVWIGPAPAAIRAMGDKGNAKEIARKAGVPVIPGYDGDDQSDARLLAEAHRIGWPVLIKAALGGGGRGQRKVTTEPAFTDALAAARREALSAFASDRMILEKALEDVRHVEVQVFGDSHGNIIHLGERDCSVQRRNQKIIEEAPAPGVDAALRNRMGEAAITLARAVGYTNAGTVEYLLDRGGNFWFLEMNTRIQVEHPVTEEITGTNLIRWQLAVAAGSPLPLRQQDVTFSGHAIEARLCAEDPGNGFSPQTGRGAWRPSSHAARTDDAGRTSGHVSGHYDSMVAKIIAKGTTRSEAITTLRQALRETSLLGIRSNTNHLDDILADRDFAAGGIDIAWLTRRGDFSDDNLERPQGALAALCLSSLHGDGWRSNGLARAIVRLRERTSDRTFIIENRSIAGLTLTRMEAGTAAGWYALQATNADGHSLKAEAFVQSTHVHVRHGGRDALFEDVTYLPAERKDPAGAGTVRAPMAGRIVKVAAEPGLMVGKGDLLVTLEAMKMEHELRAAADGVVDAVSIRLGDQVAIRQVLVTLK